MICIIYRAEWKTWL